MLPVGNGQDLSATFTPTDTDDYTTATATVSINVVQATPTITWSNPADITYGTPLGGTQLDATANVAGTFVYTPASGTVLNAGNDQTLSVTFTPTDTTDYTTATAQRVDQRRAGHADDHLVQPGGHHLRHGLGQHATGRHGQRGRDLRLHARQRDAAARRQRPDALGDLHADRHDRLHHGDRQRVDQRQAGHADDHLVQPGGHHLRHGLGQHATGRHGQRGRDLCLHARQRDGAARRQRPDALGHLHADGHDRLHHGDRHRVDQRRRRPRRRSPGPTRRTSPTARP